MLAQLRQNTINVLLSLERLLVQQTAVFALGNLWAAEFFSGRGQLPPKTVK